MGRTSHTDVVLDGHGTLKLYQDTNSYPQFQLPEGVILHAPQPGVFKSSHLGYALEQRRSVKEIILKSKRGGSSVPTQFNVYRAGDTVPNYTLAMPDDDEVGYIERNRKRRSWVRVVMVSDIDELCPRDENRIKLSQILSYCLRTYQEPRPLHCYWAACTALSLRHPDFHGKARFGRLL
ncbi:MAG: hypothetical protein GY750_02050 [Lentisphaerae bacterium]|nr:hypothetical protein [Lentisphaerota bacterium]MCP4100204.1 hypothetical protein [Lentisphaerota bacterium]